MSIATVSNNHSRRFVTPPPLLPPNKRRKERDGDVTQPLSPKLPPRLNHNNNNSYSNNRSGFVAAPRPGSPKPPLSPAAPRNQLLAGYLAHEFLTKGTLFGEPWDPSRAEGMVKPSRKEGAGSSRGGEDASKSEKEKRYAEVAELLKSGGAHLPGIVNPTQLARFLKL